MWPWRKPKMSEGEFLRYVMRAVRYDGHELNLQPPKKRTAVDRTLTIIAGLGAEDARQQTPARLGAHREGVGHEASGRKVS